MESGQIDLNPEYMSSLLLFLDSNAQASSDPTHAARQVGERLRGKGITEDAENITPVIRTEKLNDEVRQLLDAVSARLSSDTVTELVGKVVIDDQDVASVATTFLAANGLL